MFSTYQNAYKRASDPAGLKIEQRKWLEVRNACKDIDCLTTAYRTRLASLNEILAQPKPCFRLLERKWPEVQSGHYPVCVAYLKNLNSFCGESPTACERKLDPVIKELSLPKWEEVDPKANLDLIAQIVKGGNVFTPPSEIRWQVVKPEILSRIDHGAVHMWQARISLTTNGKPELLVRVDWGCMPIDAVGPDGATYRAGGIPSSVYVVDEHTGKLDKRYDYLENVEDVVLHDGKAYLLEQSGYHRNSLELGEPFSARGGYEKGKTSVCIFEHLK